MTPEQDNIAHAVLDVCRLHGIVTADELRQIAGDLPSIERAKSLVEKPENVVKTNIDPAETGIRPS